MDKKLKARWVKALESGNYKQCKGRLAGGGYYCCLGVLHKIEPKIEQDWLDGSLVPETCKIDLTDQYQLIRMNDGEGQWQGNRKSFKEIAKWIRANL